MARYYRRRRTIVRAPKKRWASNVLPMDGNIVRDNNGQFHYTLDLAKNNSEGTSPAPVIIKTGNFRVQFDVNINVAATGLIAARAFVIYVPQGLLSTADYPNIQTLVNNHPEWIMTWRQLDFGNANAAGSVDTSVVKFSSRLKRNLNTGDRIVFAIIGEGDFTGIQYAATIRGMTQFWTCAN